MIDTGVLTLVPVKIESNTMMNTLQDLFWSQIRSGIFLKKSWLALDKIFYIEKGLNGLGIRIQTQAKEISKLLMLSLPS